MSMSDDRERDYHMSAEEFRRLGHQMIDWIADYRQRAESLPVLARVQPGEIRAAMPEEPPLAPASLDTMVETIERVVLPGITHWQSPNFFAFFPSNASLPSLLGDLLASGLGVQGMSWVTSPACTEVETHVLDWLVDLMALPPAFKSSASGGGVIQDTASSASLCALLCAREKATAFAGNRVGPGTALRAYTSSQAHSSIVKAVRIAGIGDENLRLVDVDAAFAMDAQALERAIADDRRAGHTPFFVSATVGTTSSNAMDPLRAIGRICEREGLWLHVDAAMSGTAALCPEFRGLFDGLELVQSYTFNPHKWMFTAFDCNVFYVNDRRILIDTLSILPEYLRNRSTDAGEVFDYRDWHIPLGRRFRALKLWFVLHHYGVEGLRHHIREHVALAHQFAGWVRADARFEVVTEGPLNLVCFRYRGTDDENRSLLERLNQSGRVYLTHTTLAERYVLRFCVGQTRTKERHVRAAWQLMQDTVAAMDASR